MPLQGPIFRCLLMKQKKLAHKKPPTFPTDLVLWNSQAILSFKIAQEGFDAESQQLQVLSG